MATQKTILVLASQTNKSYTQWYTLAILSIIMINIPTRGQIQQQGINTLDQLIATLPSSDIIRETLIQVAENYPQPEYILYKTAFLFFRSLIIFFIRRDDIFKAVNVLAENPASSFFSGLAVYCTLPFMIAAFTISIVGIPFAIILLPIYAFLLLAYELWIVIMMTGLITKVHFPHTTLRSVIISTLLLASLSAIFAFVPAIDIIIGLFCVGAFILQSSHLIRGKK